MDWRGKGKQDLDASAADRREIIGNSTQSQLINKLTRAETLAEVNDGSENISILSVLNPGFFCFADLLHCIRSLNKIKNNTKTRPEEHNTLCENT